jgi:hypothetical protein
MQVGAELNGPLRTKKQGEKESKGKTERKREDRELKQKTKEERE